MIAACHARAAIVIVAFADVQALDVTGPREVFSLADRSTPAPGARVAATSSSWSHRSAIRASSGLRLVPDSLARALPRADRHAGRRRRPGDARGGRATSG